MKMGMRYLNLWLKLHNFEPQKYRHGIKGLNRSFKLDMLFIGRLYQESIISQTLHTISNLRRTCFVRVLNIGPANET